jgi:hypothetical protein
VRLAGGGERQGEAECAHGELGSSQLQYFNVSIDN